MSCPVCEARRNEVCCEDCGGQIEDCRRMVREELARVGLVPPNPHLEPGVYRVNADGTWYRVPDIATPEENG